MHSSQTITEANPQIHTGGGSYIAGNVDTGGGPFIGRDHIIHGDVYLYRTPQIPPSRKPVVPQASTALVGRTTELATYAECLQNAGMAIITGMAGVGKTSLAQMIVQRYPEPQRVFCHTFFTGYGLRGLIERMGEFLAWHNQPAVWQLCHSGSQPLTDELMLEHLLHDLAGGTYLIWLDDLHLVKQYPVAMHFVQQLLALTTAGQLQLLITSRQIPAFMQATMTKPLPGLTLADTQQLLAQSQLKLRPELVDALHRHTEGNAQLLHLAIGALKQTRKPSQLLARLATATEIERYLLKQVDHGLNPAEKELMKTLASLLGYPAPREVLAALYTGDDLRHILQSLSERLFVIVSHDNDERYYHQHSIVRDFYYAELNGSARRLLHQRAAATFTQLADFITAAIHWHQAGEEATAANLLYDHHIDLLNHGQAQALYNLQAQLDRAKVDDRSWEKVKFAAGRAATFVADTSTALAAFAEVLASGDLYLQAQAIYYRAQLLPKISLDEARRHFDWGITLLEPHVHDDKLTGLLSDFYLRQSFFYMLEIPDRAKAEACLDKAQNLLIETDFSRQCDLHHALSILCDEKGDTSGELAHLRQAYAAAVKTQANDLMILAAHNLGMAYVWSGEHPIGLDYLQQAQTAAMAMGHREWQGNCDQSIGASYFMQGHYSQAVDHYRAAYQAYQQIGNHNALARASRDLAEVYSQIGDFTAAQQYYSQATNLNAQLGIQNLEAELADLVQQYPALLEREKAS